MAWRGKRVLVTGAGGFIGSHLVERLLALDAEVTAFVRDNVRGDAGLLELLGETRKNIRVIYGEIREFETVRRMVEGAEVIFHLAALVGIPYSYLHPIEVMEVNALGTLNVLKAAKEAGVCRVVATSTCEVYGTALFVPTSEDHPKQPQSPYAASKIAADALALSFFYAFGLPVAIVRPFNTYGPRQTDRAIIPTIISQALRTREIRIGNTEPTRDFTFVRDTVDGFLLAAESEKCVGHELNLGSGREISIQELAETIALLIGKSVEIRRVDERARPLRSEVKQLLADCSRARQWIGWEPRVGLKEGLQLTIEWMRKNLDRYDVEAYRI
jgi:NAD dependent epimerase/dehydratase